MNDFDYLLYAEETRRDNRGRQGRIDSKGITPTADKQDRNRKVPLAESFRNGTSCRHAGRLNLPGIVAREGGTNGTD